MIKRYESEIVFICDECGEELETGAENFDEALETLRAEDWGWDEVDGRYRHYCEMCRT